MDAKFDKQYSKAYVLTLNVKLFLQQQLPFRVNLLSEEQLIEQARLHWIVNHIYLHHGKRGTREQNYLLRKIPSLSNQSIYPMIKVTDSTNG